MRTLPPQLRTLLPTKARDLERVGTLSPQFQIPPERFIQGLSYSHAGDNPPVGILLCTHKDRALVEYALAGMDNNLFVSKYKLELPSTEEMQPFIEEQARETRQEKPFFPCARRRRRGA
jgi:hypothetical protein